MEEVKWHIFNGRGKGDGEGTWTYSGGWGESVLDYVIGEMWDRIERLSVEDKVDSDHFPVMVWVRWEGERRRRRSGEERKKWRWTDEGKQLFRKKMERVGKEVRR